ncbi:hypothetical protein L249_7108, partial [Ophiocordyceps polyrhachis-furcata BCC 54312]
LLTKTKDNSLSYKDFYGYVKDSVIQAVDKELTNREEELEAGEVFVLRRYFSRYFKVPTYSTLTYLYKIGDLEEDLYVPYPALPEPESLAKEYFWSVGKKGPNEVICGAKSKEEGGEKEVEMDKELTNQEGNHVIEKKKRNHVIVSKRQLKKNWRQERWENPPSFIDNFSGIKRCAQGGVGTD